MHKITKYAYLFLAAIIWSACATSGVMIDTDKPLEQLPSQLTIQESFYIVGGAAKESSTPLLNEIARTAALDVSAEKHIIFIGDNTNEKKKEKVYRDLDRYIDMLRKSDLKSYFVPGNLDWRYDKEDGLEDMEEYLREQLDRDKILSPNNGCPIESISISDRIELITIDSEWYINDWDLHPKTNDKCAIKTREKFLQELEGELKKSAHKIILLAIHHPIYTNGYHGGRFSGREHIFPLGGNIPLPGIGTVVAQVRSQGGISKQDRFNARYRELMDHLLTAVDVDDQEIVVLSGHEQNLQYITQGNVRQVISGAGSRTLPAMISDNGLFSYGSSGYAVLHLVSNGSLWLRFYSTKDPSNSAVLLFEKQLVAPPQKLDTEQFPKSYPTTVKSSVYDLSKTEKTDFFTSFWGKHYRDVYGTQVEAPVALLDTLYGGLTVERPGGGHQTKSLRVLTKDGREFNMRALRKSAVQFLETTGFKDIDGETYFSGTVPEELILDFYTAAHPYAAFAIPALAKAAKVYYTTPQLYYVPKQEALGIYNEEYGDQLFMIVEKPSEEFTHRKSFGYPDDIESTDDLLQKLREDEDNILDEEVYIRARIFDMLIGDWDRHSDQWRWAVFENEDGKNVFEPIPRDRDQVFANFDGSFLKTLGSIMGSVNQFGVYGADIGDVKWFNAAGSKLDRALIKRSGKEVWLEQARFLQQAIDKAVLDKAFSALPIEVQDKTTIEIKRQFLLRSANLVAIVERYYDVFLQFQMVTGTDKDDLFEINRKPNGITTVNAYRIKDGKKGEPLFEKEFDSHQTDELWLYGLDDDDVFKVTGRGEKPLKIRINGGQDMDTYEIEKGKNIWIYDSRTTKNEVIRKGSAHKWFTNFYDANLYDYKRKPTTGGGIGLGVGFNPDDGAILSAHYAKNRYDYILNPYSQRFALDIDYQFLTQGLDLRVEKIYAAVIRDFNLIGNVRYTSRNYTENFFGFGNETMYAPLATNLDFNRVNLERWEGGIGLERTSVYGSFFQVKLDVSSVEVRSNGLNFAKEELPESMGERSTFLIPNATYRYANFDDSTIPSKGMLFMVQGGAIDNLHSKSLTPFINSNVTFYNSLSSNHRLVLKTVAATQLTFNDVPTFFQSARIGGDSGLRSYRNERFTGAKSLTGTADVSYRFKKLKTFFLPLDVQIFGGYDIGKVWQKQELSTLWHQSYGGGFTLHWTESLSGQASYFQGDEGGRFEFGLGFGF